MVHIQSGILLGYNKRGSHAIYLHGVNPQSLILNGVSDKKMETGEETIAPKQQNLKPAFKKDAEHWGGELGWGGAY